VRRQVQEPLAPYLSHRADELPTTHRRRTNQHLAFRNQINYISLPFARACAEHPGHVRMPRWARAPRAWARHLLAGQGELVVGDPLWFVIKAAGGMQRHRLVILHTHTHTHTHTHGTAQSQSDGSRRAIDGNVCIVLVSFMLIAWGPNAIVCRLTPRH